MRRARCWTVHLLVFPSLPKPAQLRAKRAATVARLHTAHPNCLLDSPPRGAPTCKRVQQREADVVRHGQPGCQHFILQLNRLAQVSRSPACANGAAVGRRLRLRGAGRVGTVGNQEWHGNGQCTQMSNMHTFGGEQAGSSARDTGPQLTPISSPGCPAQLDANSRLVQCPAASSPRRRTWHRPACGSSCSRTGLGQRGGGEGAIRCQVSSCTTRIAMISCAVAAPTGSSSMLTCLAGSNSGQCSNAANKHQGRHGRQWAPTGAEDEAVGPHAIQQHLVQHVTNQVGTAQGARGE